jgi:hypothetical protein
MDDHRPTADFIVEAPGRGIQLVVEAKNTTAPSPEWATRFLRNLFVHAAIPRSEYFLLALQDHLYLWRQPSPEAAAPDFDGDTAAALKPYLQNGGVSLDDLNQRTFESLIHAWLSDLVSGVAQESENLRWLKESGLEDSIRNGTVRSPVAA